MDPMLAKSIEPEKIDRYATWYMEPKLDGVRCIAIKRDGKVQLVSRQGNDLTEKLPHIEQQLRLIPLESFTLDGELGYLTDTKITSPTWATRGVTRWPIVDFNRTMRVIGSSPDVARDKLWHNFEQGHVLSYVVFDILAYDDPIIDRPFESRHDSLQGFFRSFVRDRGAVEVCPTHHAFVDDVYTEYVEQGGEGVILKNPDGLYYPKKRLAGTWAKLKTFKEADVVIDSEYLPGQGKYEGQVGALYFGAYDNGKFVRVGKCSGMTDDQRIEFTVHFDHYKGQVMTIKHFGFVGADGMGLRHPNFLRLRDDKRAEDCLLEDIYPD